jgi:hypothetical protein
LTNDRCVLHRCNPHLFHPQSLAIERRVGRVVAVCCLPKDHVE